MMTESGCVGAGTPTAAIDGVLAAFCREHAARLIAVLLVRGAAPDTAAHLVQDTLAAARYCSDRVPDLATWTYRVTTAAWDRRPAIPGPDEPGGTGDPRGADGAGATGGRPGPALLAVGAGPAAREPGREVLARLAPLGEEQRRVTAAAMLGWSPGRIAYELGVPAPDVRLLLREAATALDAPTAGRGPAGHSGGAGPDVSGDPLREVFRDLLGTLVAALDPVLDLESALAVLGGPETCPGLVRALPHVFGFDADFALRPHAVPTPRVRQPVPATETATASGGGPSPAHASALHAHAGPRTGAVPVWYEIQERGRQPRAELAAVRLATLLALHTDRLRSELRMPGLTAPAEDARTFAVALARDVRAVADRFPGGPGADASRAAGALVEALSEEDPDPLDVAEAALGLAKAVALLRARALDATLRAVRPQRASQGRLMEAVTHDLLRARNMSDELDFLEADLAYDLLQPELPGTDAGRDLARHRAFNEQLCAGIDRIEEVHGDARDADVSPARLDGVPLVGVQWTAGTRWPADRAGLVRSHSVETAPGHFTIAPGLDPHPSRPQH